MESAVPHLQKVPGELMAGGRPVRRHLPGSGSQPDMALLQQAKLLCPQQTRATQWQNNPAYRYGWWLFAHEYYWETHEIWEEVWQRAPPNSRHRYLLQCLIQLANTRLKSRQGRTRAALRLLDHCRALRWDAFPGGPGSAADELMGLSALALEKLIEGVL